MLVLIKYVLHTISCSVCTISLVGFDILLGMCKCISKMVLNCLDYVLYIICNRLCLFSLF